MVAAWSYIAWTVEEEAQLIGKAHIHRLKKLYRYRVRSPTRDAVRVRRDQ